MVADAAAGGRSVRIQGERNRITQVLHVSNETTEYKHVRAGVPRATQISRWRIDGHWSLVGVSRWLESHNLVLHAPYEYTEQTQVKGGRRCSCRWTFGANSGQAQQNNTSVACVQ